MVGELSTAQGSDWENLRAQSRYSVREPTSAREGLCAIDLRRSQSSFGDGLIAGEVGDLCEPRMQHADDVLADEQIVGAVYEALSKRHPKRSASTARTHDLACCSGAIEIAGSQNQGFAVDGSVIVANASRYHGKAPEEIVWAEPEHQTRAVREYLAGLEAENEPNPDRKPPKVISPSDPCRGFGRWHGNPYPVTVSASVSIVKRAVKSLRDERFEIAPGQLCRLRQALGRLEALQRAAAVVAEQPIHTSRAVTEKR
jgi:hypothetical protein